MTPVHGSFGEEPALPGQSTQWSKLYATGEQIRQEALSAHLDGLLAAARFAEIADYLGFRKSAMQAHERVSGGYRRIIDLLSSDSWAARYADALGSRLERLRLALRINDTELSVAEAPPAEACPTERSAQTPAAALTARETEVLKLIAEGKSSKQVAYLLGITFKTAVCHRSHIMGNLQIHDVSGLVRYAVRTGLVQP